MKRGRKQTNPLTLPLIYNPITTLGLYVGGIADTNPPPPPTYFSPPPPPEGPVDPLDIRPVSTS